MKSYIHRSHERGMSELGWLHSKFSFSFAEYRDPKRMGFGALRVINDDVVEPENGFGMHMHQNMQILSIVTKGALEHKDSQGNKGVINEGEIQYMSAGSGIYHSEFNPSKDQKVEFFQIWIIPNVQGGKPLYVKKDIASYNQNNRWIDIVSANENSGAIQIRQNANLSLTTLEEGFSIDTKSTLNTHGRLLFVIEGSVNIEGEILTNRDEIQLLDSAPYSLKAIKRSKIMVFEVPMNIKG